MEQRGKIYQVVQGLQSVANLVGRAVLVFPNGSNQLVSQPHVSLHNFIMPGTGWPQVLRNEFGTVLNRVGDEVAEVVSAAGSSPNKSKPALPTDSAERKRWPLFSGLLRYFPSALAQVCNHSYIGNEKHNPGMPLQHARGKSSDHEDCIMRHLLDASEHPTASPARIDELRGVAWRALALLQEECEKAGHQPAPAASFDHAK